MKIVKNVGFVLASFMFVNCASAWDLVAGKILRVEIREGDMRILLEGTPVLCGTSGVNWSYASRFKPNYDSFLSVILAAQMAGKSISLYSAVDSSNLCEIQAVYLQ